jgi:hypothetical protein
LAIAVRTPIFGYFIILKKKKKKKKAGQGERFSYKIVKDFMLGAPVLVLLLSVAVWVGCVLFMCASNVAIHYCIIIIILKCPMGSISKYIFKKFWQLVEVRVRI